LRLWAAAGLHEWLAHLTAAWPWLAPRPGDYCLETTELGPGAHMLGSLRVEAFPINHTAQSLAYRVRVDGEAPTVTFSGDADEGLGLVDAARDARLFVCDAAFPDAAYVPGHLTPGRAGRVAAAAGVETPRLPHFHPECHGVDLAAQARTTFAGEVVLASDQRRFDVK
jgi:ribonuclease BN (tRNA processing enzyme)